MPFTDAFSIANPFSVNPQYSNTPQAAQAKAAQAKANTPAAVSTPAPASEEQGSGAESLSAARTSPLMEAIGGYHEQTPSSHSSMPSPSSSLTGTETPAAQSYIALANALGIQVTQQDINNANSATNPSNNGVYGGGGSGLRSSGTPGTPVTITTTPSTGVNQLPYSIQSELQSGKISSWTNPSTGQTWYAPNAIGQGDVLWVSGKNYSGPVQSSNGVEYINAGGQISQVNAPSTTTITQNGNILYQGFTANAPHIEYNANGEFTGLLNIPQTSSPAAKFTDYQTFNTPDGPVTLPTSIQDGQVVETGAWAQSANGGYSFTPSSYQFSNGSTTLTLTNPTISELESYGFKKDNAEQLLQGLSGALLLSISPSGEGYSVSLTPANGATQVVNVPIPTINGATTGGVEFGTGKYVQPPTIPIVYSYGEDGVGTPVGFQGSSGQTNTYTETINGQSYTFVIDNDQIEYAPTGSTTFSQLQFNASPTAQSGIALASSAAATPPSATSTQTPLQGIEAWLGQNIVSPVESALAPVGAAFDTYVAKPFEQNVVQPVGQLEQGVLNTPLPSPQSLQASALKLAQTPNLMFAPSEYSLSQTLQGNQAPIAQGQQPTTIGSLLNSAGTSASSFLNNNVEKPIYNLPSDIENFLNYYPVTNGPGQAFGTYTFNTPIQNLKYNFSTQNEWTETSMPGIYINPATHEYWNSNNYEVNGFKPMNSLPPNVATPSSLFNQYVAKPFEQNVTQPIYQWWYNNYGSPQAIHAVNQYNAQQQHNVDTNLSNEALVALENAFMNQAKQNAPPILGNWEATGLSPYSLAARVLAVPSSLTNVPAGLSHLESGINQFLTGVPFRTLPYNPAGNLIYSQIPHEIHNFNTLVNEGINSSSQSAPINSILPNSARPFAEGLEKVPGEALNYGLLQPAEAVMQGAFNVGSPYSSNAQKALGAATVASSIAMPGRAALYGLGSGLINMGVNYLMGGAQSPTAAMRSGYQFGAATAPLFEGAQLLGEGASKFLFPLENQYQDVLDVAKSFDGPTRDAVNAFKAEFMASNPGATTGDINGAVLDFINENKEINSALLSLDAERAGNPATIARGLAKLAVRTAPVSTLMGGITSGLQYVSGVRNPTQLAEDFGLGYLGGEAMQTVIPAFLDGILHLKAMALNLNPDTVNLVLRGTPFADDNGNLYYVFDQHTPEGLMPTKFLLSTTQQVQSAADLEAQITAAADAMKVDPDVVRSTLMSNNRAGMSPEDFYKAIVDSQKGSYLGHATPSNFPEGIADTGKTVTPPKGADIGDTLRKLLTDFQGLYNAPADEFGIPQVYNYLGVRPDLSQNMEQKPMASNKVGIVTQLMNKEGDYLPFRQFVDAMNNEGAGINLDTVSKDTQDFIGDAKRLGAQKFADPQAKIDAFNELKDEPKYSKLIDLYDKYNKYARLNDYNQIDSVRHALLGSGETEVVTPVGYSLKPVFDTLTQKPMSYSFITTEPNAGVFEGTPFSNLIPTTRFGAQTFATAVAPALSEAEKEALESELGNYKYNSAPATTTENPAETPTEEANPNNKGSNEQAASSSAYYRNVLDTVTNLLSDVISKSMLSTQSPSPSAYSYAASPSISSISSSISPSISSTPSVATSVSPSISESVSPSISYSTSPSISESVSPSTIQSISPSESSGESSSSASTSSSTVSSTGSTSSTSSGSSYGGSGSSTGSSTSSSGGGSSFTYPGSIRKPIEILPPLKGSEWFSPQERLLATNPYAAYASIYSPSLLPEVMPGLESLAEQQYSPMTALSTIRPLRAPSVNTPITLPPYSTPSQPTIMEENLPGTPNYNKAQSSPMPHAVSTPSYSFNEPFSNAPAATQASPIKDPALLQPVSTAANPVSFGMLPATAPPSAYGAIANPMLQSLSRLNMNSLRLPALPNSLSTPNMLGSRAMGATSAATPAFGFAGYSAPRIGNISLIPTAQDIMSVLGPDQMLRLLNQINPTKFSVTNIQYAPRSALAAALNSLSYSDIVLLMSRMSVQQRMMVYGLLGIPPGEALIIAESGTQGLFIPSLSNALASTTRKRIVPTPQNVALPGQPMPSALPSARQVTLPINPTMPRLNRQLVTV